MMCGNFVPRLFSDVFVCLWFILCIFKLAVYLSGHSFSDHFLKDYVFLVTF